MVVNNWRKHIYEYSTILLTGLMFSWPLKGTILNSQTSVSGSQKEIMNRVLN